VILPVPTGGHGTTRLLADDHDAERPAVVVRLDTVALMTTLGIDSAIVAGFDWGARSANVVAALWPERCKRWCR